MKLLRFRGITLELHPTFYLLPLLVGWEGWSDGRWPGLAENLWAIALIYTCLVLHEFGHALTAQRLGLPVKHIVLLPIGGMALLQRMPRNPRTEMLITAAGPAVNFAIAGICLVLLRGWPPRLLQADHPTFHLLGVLRFLLLVNLGLGCFNLLPAYPMDGGRVLRALLAFRLDYLDATRWAVTIGYFVAGSGIVLALLYGLPTLVVLFVFILYIGNWEYRQLRREGNN
jgi:Zn-dependent protease